MGCYDIVEFLKTTKSDEHELVTDQDVWHFMDEFDDAAADKLKEASVTMHHCICVPNDVLFIPVGMVVAERCLTGGKDSKVWQGVRQNSLYNTPASIKNFTCVTALLGGQPRKRLADHTIGQAGAIPLGGGSRTARDQTILLGVDQRQTSRSVLSKLP